MSREPIAATCADYLIDPPVFERVRHAPSLAKAVACVMFVFRVTSVRHGAARVVARSYATSAFGRVRSPAMSALSP